MQRVVACAIGVAAGTYLGFLYAEMVAPVLIARVDVETERVAAGGDLQLKVHAFQLRNDCSFIETRTFVAADGTRRSYTLEMQYQGQPIGGVVEERHIRVPHSVPVGPAELIATFAYSCGSNWLQQWWPTTVRVRHIYFDVTGPEE